MRSRFEGPRYTAPVTSSPSSLHGLRLLFRVGASLYNTKSTNEFMANAAVKLETLKALNGPLPGLSARRKLLVRLIEASMSDTEVVKWGGAIIGAIGFWMMDFGFCIWQFKVQRIQPA